MTIYVPWGLIAIFIAFYIFHEHNRRMRLRREERREELNNRRQELIDQIVNAKPKEKNSSNNVNEKTDNKATEV